MGAGFFRAIKSRLRIGALAPLQLFGIPRNVTPNLIYALGLRFRPGDPWRGLCSHSSPETVPAHLQETRQLRASGCLCLQLLCHGLFLCFSQRRCSWRQIAEWTERQTAPCPVWERGQNHLIRLPSLLQIVSVCAPAGTDVLLPLDQLQSRGRGTIPLRPMSARGLGRLNRLARIPPNSRIKTILRPFR